MDTPQIDAHIQEESPVAVVPSPSLNVMELFKKIGFPIKDGVIELGLLLFKQTDATTMGVSFLGGEAIIKNLSVAQHSLTSFSLSGIFKFIKPITFECNVKISVIKEKNRAMPVVQITGSTVPYIKLKPFEKVSVLNLIPQVKNIALQNIALSLDSKGRIFIAGDSEIFGFRNTAKLMFHVKGFALSIKVPDDWHLSEAFPQLKGTDFDTLLLITPHFIATTSSYFDEDLEKNFASGITLVFKSKFNTGPFKTMYKSLSKFNEKTGVPVVLPEELMFYGTISPILQNNRFGSSLGINLTFKKDRFLLKDIALEVGGYPPALFAKTHIWIKPHGQEEFLIFTGQLEANPQGREMAIAGSMEGDWIDVFGIKGLTIRNVGLEVALGQSMVAGLAKTVVSKAIGRVAGMVTGGAGGGGTAGVSGGVAAGGGGAGVGAVGAGVGAIAGVGTGAAGGTGGAIGGGAGGGAAGGEAGDTAASAASSAVPDALVISRFGITGEMAIGDQTVALGVKIAPELWYNMVLMGKLKYLPITDIVKFLAQIPEKMLAQQKRRVKKLTGQEVKILEEIHKKIKLDKILAALPGVTFKDLDLLIAPLGGSIGEIFFEQGFRAKGQVVIKIFDKELFNSMIDLEFGLMPPLLKAIGTTKNLDIFGLKVTGAGVDGVFGTADDGPTVKISFSLEDLIGGQAGVVVSGKVEFLGYSSNTDLIIKTDKIYFDTGVNFFGAFNTNIHAETVIAKNGKPDFVFTGNFDDDMAGALQKSISEQLKLFAELEQKATEKIDNAQQELNNALATLNAREKELGTLSSKMNSIRSQIAGCTQIKKSFLGFFKSARKTVTNAPRLAKLNVELAKAGAEYAAKQASIQTAQLAVKGAKAHISATKSGIKVGGIIVKKTGDVSGTVVQKLTETANALRVKQVRFNASLQAFLKGELPELTINCIVLGKDQ